MTYYPVQSPYPIFNDEDGTPLEDGYIYIGEAYQNPITNLITATWDTFGLYPAAQPIRTIAGYPDRNGSPGIIYVNAGAFEDYSILVQDKNGNQIYFEPSAVSATGGLAGNSVDVINDLRAINGFDLPIYVRGHTTTGDGGEGTFEWIDGAAPGTYVDDNGCTIVPTGGDGSGAWLRMDVKGEVFVEQFGATGDGATDDYTAIQAAFDYARENEMGVAFRQGTYLSNTSIFGGETIADRSRRGLKYIRGAGMKLTILKVADAGNPCLDMIGARWYSIKDIGIEGDDTDVPNVGILAARLDYDVGAGVAPSVGEAKLSRVEITGEFSIAALYTYGSEEMFYNECIIRNLRAAGASTIYITDTNETHSVTSIGTTIAGTTTNARQSNIGHYFNNCSVFDYTAINAPESAIYLKAGKTFHFKNTFVYLAGAGKVDPYMFNLDQETSSDLLVDIKIRDCYFEQIGAADLEIYAGSSIIGFQYTGNRGSGAGMLAAAGVQLFSLNCPNIIECDSVDFSGAACDMLGYNQVYIKTAFSIADYFNGDVFTDHETTPTITIGDPTHFLGQFHRDVGVSVYPAAAQTIATGSTTLLVLDTENYDLNSDFASNTFTAPVPGIYHIDYQATFEAMADGTDFIIYIYLNTGGGYAEYSRVSGVTASAGDRHSLNITRSVKMTNGDAIRFYVRQNSGGNIDTVGNNAYTYATIALNR